MDTDQNHYVRLSECDDIIEMLNPNCTGKAPRKAAMSWDLKVWMGLKIWNISFPKDKVRAWFQIKPTSRPEKTRRRLHDSTFPHATSYTKPHDVL